MVMKVYWEVALLTIDLFWKSPDIPVESYYRNKQINYIIEGGESRATHPAGE